MVTTEMIQEVKAENNLSRQDGHPLITLGMSFYFLFKYHTECLPENLK